MLKLDDSDAWQGLPDARDERVKTSACGNEAACAAPRSAQAALMSRYGGADPRRTD